MFNLFLQFTPHTIFTIGFNSLWINCSFNCILLPDIDFTFFHVLCGNLIVSKGSLYVYLFELNLRNLLYVIRLTPKFGLVYPANWDYCLLNHIKQMRSTAIGKTHLLYILILQNNFICYYLLISRRKNNSKSEERILVLLI